MDKLLGLAESYAVNAVLCAGDLFDEPAPRRPGGSELLRLFDRRKWSDRPVFLLPGNHDPLRPNSVWAEGPSPSAPDCRRGSTWWIATISNSRSRTKRCCTPCRAAVRRARTIRRCGSRARAAGDARIRIGMVHGQTFDVAGPSDQLSHRRRRDRSSEGSTISRWATRTGSASFRPRRRPAVYPGAPEAATFGETDAGHVAMVLFPRQGRPPIVQKHPVSRWRWRTEQCTGVAQLEGLRMTISRIA